MWSYWTAVKLKKTSYLEFPYRLYMITPGDKKSLLTFGENLRRLRKEKGMSLREMSYACSIDNSKIAKIEKGQINITLTTLLQLAQALELPASALLDYAPAVG